MINRVVIVGRLTRDADLKYTSSGTAVGQFNMAVNRQFTNANGDREADFINCVIWRKSAESFANFTHKGSLVGIEGRLQTRNYENQQGQRVYVTEVVVDNFSLLEARGDDKGTNKAPFNGNNAGTSNKQGSQATTKPQNDPFANNGTPLDISDDDLPF